MSEERVSMFISHKVASCRAAAERAKAILEARTERLDVHICETIPAGDKWREWIVQRIAQSGILLVIVPPSASDMTWIDAEIALFREASGRGRIIVMRQPGGCVPDALRELQVVDICDEQLQEQFLTPLYRDPGFTGLISPLNGRVSDGDIARDAAELTSTLLGLGSTHSEIFGESLVVEVGRLDATSAAALDEARVHAPNGCREILNWNRRSFSWRELEARAAEDRGKGTFWIAEMAQVIEDVARQNRPRVMTSTFRGRGEAVGQIFNPRLLQVDFIGDTPIRYHFAFGEVLVPELVRGPAQIGEVFNLLYLATRVRWEVLNPFLVNMVLSNDPASLRELQDADAQQALIERVVNSLRVIEAESERHQMLETAVEAFEHDDRTAVLRLLEQHRALSADLERAALFKDFARFLATLEEALVFNGKATEVLATRFLALAREDSIRVTQMIASARPPEPAMAAPALLKAQIGRADSGVAGVLEGHRATA